MVEICQNTPGYKYYKDRMIYSLTILKKNRCHQGFGAFLISGTPTPPLQSLPQLPPPRDIEGNPPSVQP